MRDPQELLQNAEDCVRRAGQAPNEEQRQTLLETANAWRKLAEQQAQINEFEEKSRREAEERAKRGPWPS
jgi:hypothetical protein